VSKTEKGTENQPVFSPFFVKIPKSAADVQKILEKGKTPP